MVSLFASKITVIIIVLTGVLLTLTTIGALNDSKNINFEGTIESVNLEIYSDATCTNPCTTINLGTLHPGTNFTKTIYIKNNSSIPLTLSMTSNNWNPIIANDYLNLSWNRQNYILNPGKSCEATLILEVETNAEMLTSFSFRTTITGIQ